MRRRRYSWRTLLWSAIQIGIGAFLLSLVACWRSEGQLPTLVPTASVLTPGVAWQQGTIPPTYTPAATPSPGGIGAFVGTPAATSTLPPAVLVPEPQAPPTPSPTPFIAPDYLQREVEVLTLDQPPVATDCDGTGVVFRSRYPSPTVGGWRYYHAYLPPCYGHDGRTYPVLYLFHGSGHTDYQWVELGVAQHTDHGLSDGEYPPFIVIMPMNGDLDDTTSGGQRSVEGVTINDLLPFVEENFCTWEQREGRSLGGISRGGYWALMMAFRYTSLFGAVSGHSSHLRLETDGPEFNPLATYAGADLSGTEIWLDWGDYDFLRPGQKRLHESLMNAGVPHRVNINPGGHANYYWYAHLEEYLDWHVANWPRDRESYPPCER